jgi:hypothetical protein
MEYIYKSREDGSIVGGFPLQTYIPKDMGSSRFENLVVPAGLFIQGHSIHGGGYQKVKEYLSQEGGDKIVDRLLNHIIIGGKKKGGRTQKHKRILNRTKRIRQM